MSCLAAACRWGRSARLTGPASSGRTSLALKFVAQTDAEARACAWVDVNDALDPESAAANGVRLRQLLWVRCRDEADGSEKTADGRAGRASDGRGSTRRCGRRICCCRRVDLRRLCWTWATRRRSKRAGFRWRRGSATGRRRSARNAAWWCWARGPMRSRPQAVVLECAAVRAEEAGGTVLRGLRFAVRRGQRAVCAGRD